MAHDRLLQMRVSAEFLEMVDDWRRAQPEIPPRAEAIRALVTKGLGLVPSLDELEGKASRERREKREAKKARGAMDR
jgi:hypothetical protein